MQRRLRSRAGMSLAGLSNRIRHRRTPDERAISPERRGRPSIRLHRRLDQAMTRLETQHRTVEGARCRHSTAPRPRSGACRGERTRLAAELDRANTRARRLDDKAGEVSRRLVDAMEGVKTVLVRRRLLMPEVFVEINGRKYRMACEEGQESASSGARRPLRPHGRRASRAISARSAIRA